MSSEPVFHHKNVGPDHGIVEIKIWRVPKTKDKPFGFRYSLVYIRDGKRVIGYDNGEGKGDHKHTGNKEAKYIFKNVDALVEDFYRDVLNYREAHK